MMNIKPPKWLKVTIQIAFFVLIIYLFEGYGVVGMIIFMVAFSGYRMWKMRSQIKQSIQYIETMIWGKPLEKDYWEKGELKNTKIEIDWGGKKMIDNNIMGKIFFAAWFIFSVGFAYWHNTFIGFCSVYCLIFAGLFKTWHIIREVK